MKNKKITDPEFQYYKNGNKRYESYVNDLDQCHNDIGPAFIIYYINGNKEYEEYSINGIYHNTKGPARIWYKQNNKIELKEYWLNGNFINVKIDEEFEKYIKRLNIS